MKTLIDIQRYWHFGHYGVIAVKNRFTGEYAIFRHTGSRTMDGYGLEYNTHVIDKLDDHGKWKPYSKGTSFLPFWYQSQGLILTDDFSLPRTGRKYHWKGSACPHYYLEQYCDECKAIQKIDYSPQSPEEVDTSLLER